MAYIFPIQVFKAKRLESRKTRGADLKTILNSAEGIKVFATYLVTEVSVENLCFYLAIKCWHRDYESLVEQEKEKERASSIISKYLLPSAPLEINVSHAIREDILRRQQREEFGLDLFDLASTDVYNLMANDSFSRFQRSPQFLAYMNSLTIENRDRDFHLTEEISL